MEISYIEGLFTFVTEISEKGYLQIPSFLPAPTRYREHLEIVLAQTQDLELRQTSRDCAEHLEFGLHELKIIYLEL